MGIIEELFKLKDGMVGSISGLIEGDTKGRIIQKLTEMGVDNPELTADTIIKEIEHGVHERLKREYGEGGLDKDFTRAAYTRSVTNSRIKNLDENPGLERG
ncbi:MAG: hypothetical protein FWE16_04085 [Firmicutes bacterium]|nr:hypothetical protein [Bacillota bacterium]